MLTPEQLERLRLLVDERCEALANELHRDAERWREDSRDNLAGPVVDSGDRASADLIADLDSAELNRDLDELRQMEAAQQRIADGSYGMCIDCGGDIDYQRLQVQPAALRCVDCQQVHEKTVAQAPHGSL